MYSSTFKYRPEDVDCKLCTEYSTKTGCRAKGCPWLAERMEAGVVNCGGDPIIRDSHISMPAHDHFHVG